MLLYVTMAGFTLFLIGVLVWIYYHLRTPVNLHKFIDAAKEFDRVDEYDDKKKSYMPERKYDDKRVKYHDEE